MLCIIALMETASRDLKKKQETVEQEGLLVEEVLVEDVMRDPKFGNKEYIDKDNEKKTLFPARNKESQTKTFLHKPLQSLSYFRPW